MLSFFKKKKEVRLEFDDNVLVSAGDGRSVSLSEVPDDVFSKKMMGDGFAIILQGDTIVAPANGKISMIFPTGHAFGMSMENGIEILVHIGLDTVSLAGKGFKVLVKENSYVKAGEPIVKIDKNYIEQNGFNTITMVVVTNNNNYDISIQQYGEVKKGEDIVVMFKDMCKEVIEDKM